MYAFAKQDAARSFREAWRRDPNCAICYWGEAWAWGSYLNGPMRPAEAPFAYAAIQRARDLAAAFASEGERAFIEAMVPRYVAQFDPDRRREQDTAYAESMRGVYETYPDDLDAATLYAEALFLLEPRRGTRDLDTPDVRRLHGVLEGILARDIRHPGACHLYIHATESTTEPGRAEACAEFVGNSIPGASHINHMPSHTWNEIGRWGDAVRANIQAWHSDQKAAIGEGFAIYPQHNLHMLLFAASMDGQGAVATQAGKDYAKLTGDSFYQALTLLRFGRFDEILALDNRPDNIVTGGLWDFAQGYARLRKRRERLRGGLPQPSLEGRRINGRHLPVSLGDATARRGRRHPGGGNPSFARQPRRGHRLVRASGDDRGWYDLRRARAIAVRGSSLARGGVARSEPIR